MPEFYPQHVPDGVDDFTHGYLKCVEWLLPEETDKRGEVIGPVPHDRMTGFSRDAVRKAVRDCKMFQHDNAADLVTFCDVTNRDMDSAGQDFFLTRNHHGAGFWDRGAGEIGKRLSDAAHGYGETYEYLTRRGRLVSE